MKVSATWAHGAGPRSPARLDPLALSPSGGERGWGQAGSVACCLLPGALLVYLSFRAGGLFVDATALIAVFLAVLIVLRLALADDPLAGMSVRLGVAAAALCLYAAWSLVSVSWSEAPGRVLTEFDRTLVYLFGLLLLGSFARTASRIRWLVRGVSLGVFAVCVAGFVSRTIPELWSATPSPLAPDRLSFPITYWNAMGMVAAIGIIACFYLTTSKREPPWVRVMGAAALPLLAATLLLTFSRGAIAGCIVGLLAYAVLARPHALLGGLIASVPPTIVAVLAAYGAEEVATPDVPAEAIEQGHDLALLTLACVAFAAIVRAVALYLDRSTPILGARVGMRLRAATAVLVAIALGASLAGGGAGVLDRQYDRFVGGGVEETQVRDRLTQVGNHGRIAHWEVALRGFRENRLLGQGAGTYPVLWSQYRPASFDTTEGHSLYLETLGELGVVGLMFLVVCLGALLVGTAAGIRGPDRAVYGALFAAMLAWAACAGIEWLWELPAVTFWVFCGGGIALAASAKDGAPRRAPLRHRTRGLIGLGVALLALTPALMGFSQRHLNDSFRAFTRGDCSAAVDAALDSISTLSVRPEPYEILGYCDARQGLGPPAVRAFEAAIRRDPDNWELHYGRAIAQATSGMDPRPAARSALRLNPRGELAEAAVKGFGTDSATAWRRQARVTPLLIPCATAFPLKCLR